MGTISKYREIGILSRETSMAKIEEMLSVPGSTPDDCYDAALLAFPKAGFEIWKERRIGWLLMARRSEGGNEINSNISVRFGDPVPVTVIVSSERVDESGMRPLFERVLAELKKALKL